MADTLNFTTYAAQVDVANGIRSIGVKGDPWVAVLDGQIVGVSLIAVNSDGKQKSNPNGFEWVERATATPPDAAVVGVKIFAGESLPIGDLGAGQSIYARALDSTGGILVVTPGG